MSNISLIIAIVSFSLLYLYLLNLIKIDKFNNDLLFFLIIGIILIFTLAVFYYYFQELNISLIISGLLVVNNTLLLRELYIIKRKSTLFGLPYLIFFIYIFFKILIKFLQCV